MKTDKEQTKYKLKDPVCGKEVSAQSPYHSYYKNGTYYFCSAEDKEEFDKQPDKYTADEPEPVGSCD